MNYNLTPEQLKEIENRTGTSDLRRTQFNIKLADGTIIPAGINPGSAATIQLGGGVMDRSTTEGQQIASQFPATTVNPQQELAKAQAETPVIGGTQPLGQPFGQFTTAGEQPTQPAPQAPKPFGDFTYGPDQPAQTPNQDLSQQLNQMMTTLQGMQQQATGQTGGGVYTVQSGDTLSAIAAKNGMSLQQLLQNNPQFQANPNLIIPGQQVNLGGQAVTQQPVSPTPTQPPAQTITNSADTKVQNSLQAITTGDPTKSLTDIVKELSISMGLPEITNQIQELDNKMTQEISDINLNPWLSEAERSKRTGLTQQKYETRKEALVDRLKLQSDVVNQAVEYYQAERQYQKDMMFKQLELAEKDIERKTDIGIRNQDTIMKIATTAATNGASSELVSRISIANSPQEALIMAANYLLDPIEQSSELLKLEKLKLEIEALKNPPQENKPGSYTITPSGKVMTPEQQKTANLYTAVEFLSTSPALSAAVGPVSSRIPTTRGATADFEAYFNNFKSNMTLDNMSLMKGVLSDADMKVLSQAASPLSLSMSEAQFKSVLNQIKSTLNRSLAAQGFTPEDIGITNINNPLGI